MKKRKIIIEVHGKITDLEALEYVRGVVNGGRVSNHSKGAHYCWVSVYKDKTTVAVRTKKTKNSPDSFIVY